MKIDIIKEVDNFSKTLDSLQFIRAHDVYVGIQQKDDSREDDDVTNAELLFIHTNGARVKKRRKKGSANDLYVLSNGSPYFNIPPRPVIEPALKSDQKRLSSMMKQAAKYAFDGNKSEALRQLELVGTRGRDVSKRWFVNPDNNWPPNSEVVQERKRRKGSTNPRPLIDTGELKNSISYFVRTKEGRKSR